MPRHPTDYVRRPLRAPDPRVRLRLGNPRVRHVKAAFNRLFRRGDYLAFHDGGKIPWPRYTADPGNGFGKGNHFQGVQRLGRGTHLVVSGGDPHRPRSSHVFVVRVASRAARGPWGSNLRSRHRPTNQDAIVRTISISRTYWHAGGVSVCGDIMAVGVEGTKSSDGSQVLFYSVRDPNDPRQFAHKIIRKRKKAGAVALTRLESGFFLVAVLTGKTIDFYLSRTADFFNGFSPTPSTWRTTALRVGRGGDKNFGEYQTINFVTQSDGLLFLVGLHNTSLAAPVVPGRDYVDLFSVSVPHGATRATPALGTPTITKVGKRQFFCHGGQCNMDGAAGLHVTPSGELLIYSTFHWRMDGGIRFTEFREQVQSNAAAVTTPGEGWVDLFEHARFAGRRLSIIGKKDSTIPDYGKISVQGAAFDDLISSARWQLPRGMKYVMYEHRNYEGRRLTLRGTGRVEEISNSGRAKIGSRTVDFNDKVSSSRYE